MRKKQWALVAVIVLVVLGGTWLPQAIVRARQARMMHQVWTARQTGEDLSFAQYPTQYGDVELSGGFSAQAVKDALESMILRYIDAGLLPDTETAELAMTEFSIGEDAQGKSLLHATLQCDAYTLGMVLAAEEALPRTLTVQSGGELPATARRFAMLAAQYYRIKGTLRALDGEGYRFSAKDDQQAFTVTQTRSPQGVTLTLQAGP